VSLAGPVAGWWASGENNNKNNNNGITTFRIPYAHLTRGAQPQVYDPAREQLLLRLDLLEYLAVRLCLLGTCGGKSHQIV